MGELGSHDAGRRFEAIAREVDRLRSFETELPEELLRLRASLNTLSRSPIEVPRQRLDHLLGPADRLVRALQRWRQGLRPMELSAVTVDVIVAVHDLETTLDLLPLMAQSAQREATNANSPVDRAANFYRLAEHYDLDAQRHRTTMNRLYIFAAIGLVGAIAAALWTSLGPWSQLGMRGLVVFVALVTAIVILWQADRHRRVGAEQFRIAQQMRTFPTFIGQMSNDILQDLMRGTLTPRFFPGALDDDDVLREPLWPNADQLLRSLLKAEGASSGREAGGGVRNSSSDDHAGQ